MNYCYSHSHGCQWEYASLRPPPEATKKETIDPKVELNEMGVERREFAGTIERLVFKRSIFPDTGDL